MTSPGTPGDSCLQEAAWIAEAARVPVWFEPTSPPKSIRWVPILGSTAFVSPNSNELIAMASGLRAAGGLPPLPDPPPKLLQEEVPPAAITSGDSSSSRSAARHRLQALQPHIRTLLEVPCLTCLALHHGPPSGDARAHRLAARSGSQQVTRHTTYIRS